MQEIYSGGEPIKVEIFPIENLQENQKKNSGGKALKAKFLTIGYVQENLKKLDVVKR